MTTSRRSNIWPARAWATIPCGRWRPTLPISKPGVPSPSALPSPGRQPESLLLKFVAHHLWDPEKRENDPDHGMPHTVDQILRSQGFLKSAGPHAHDTVRRRLASWSTLTKWRGFSGAFTSPALKQALRLAVRAVPRPRKRKSAKAVTGDILAKLLAT